MIQHMQILHQACKCAYACLAVKAEDIIRANKEKGEQRNLPSMSLQISI